MEYMKLKSAAETITMPTEMKQHIAENCKTQISNARKDTPMKTNKNRTFFGKSAVSFAALAVCLTLTVTALAGSDSVKGFFRDITNWQGAIVGTSYEQATNEIAMTATVSGDALTVLVAFADPQAIPYKYAETLGIAAYSILDANGKVVIEGSAAPVEIVSGQAVIHIPLIDLGRGTYKLAVSAFISGKKADQPLNLNGSWESVFTK